MGIRFLCPHCQQRLNIKAAQAGLRGQCPQCDQTIQIPLESSIQSPSSSKRIKPLPEHEQLEIDQQVTLAGLDASLQSGSESASGWHSVSSTSIAERPSPRSTASSNTEPFLLDKPQLPSTMGKIDPIAEAPGKVWYFRSQEFGERGPLKARQMQEQLDAGVVTIGCIVWREDWDDWHPAERVFPSLVKLVESARAVESRESSSIKTKELKSRSRFRLRHRRRRMITMVIFVGSMLIVAGLVYLLIRLVA